MHHTVTLTSTPAFRDLPDLLTVKEVAAILRIDTQTARGYVKAGRLPALRLSPIDLRIKREALEAFLDAAARTPRARRRPPGAERAAGTAETAP